jgi:hypothetical protein
MKNKKFSGIQIAFFEPAPDIATNPSLICLIEELTNAGAAVDVFMPMHGNYPKIKEGINIYPFPKKIRLWSGSIRRTLNSYLSDVQCCIRERVWRAYSILNRNRYDLAFGVNDTGLITAVDSMRNNRVPIIYLSYEIFFKDELLTYIDRKEKTREIKASQLVDLVLIQDKWRADLLARENNIDEKKFAYLPVAPRLAKDTIKSQYLRKKYNIPENKFIVLHSGSFANWTHADELLENVDKWPDNTILLIHTRYRPDDSNKQINKIINKNLPNVILSTDPLDNETYEKMVCSADIGLVLYKQMPGSKYVQKNIETIGLSSGKFAYFMKYSLPVISIGSKTYSKLLKEYKFGFNINSFVEMPGTLTNIISDYDNYSKEACRLFSEKLPFDLYWPSISNKILELLDLNH